MSAWRVGSGTRWRVQQPRTSLTAESKSTRRPMLTKTGRMPFCVRNTTPICSSSSMSGVVAPAFSANFPNAPIDLLLTQPHLRRLPFRYERRPARIMFSTQYHRKIWHSGWNAPWGFDWQSAVAVAPASRAAVVLHRFASGPRSFQSARGLAESRTLRRFEDS
jgi:hypothetical protein